MLYEIREENGKFKLFLARKNGLKFKETFAEREWAEMFVQEYFRRSCLKCLERGWVYKTRRLDDLQRGGSHMLRGNRGGLVAGSIMVCPECRTKYQVQKTDWLWVLAPQYE